jgi:alkanesulfonate monooxygenase SsuD/methylene tetrahydromethanopterin reductase-like flavin-dependent oxidoreductase (luciferase family)
MAGRTAGECLDQLATLAFLAARTERLRLLTSVMVVPQRHPVLTAKMLATIDVLSAGRLIVGCGVGWLKEEFEAAGAPDFAERGRGDGRVSGCLQGAVDGRRSRLRGQHVQFENIMFAPKPVQKPHPPIWIGGERPSRHETGGARRRRLVSCLQQPAASPGHRRALGAACRSCGRSARPPGATRLASTSPTSP